MIIFNIKLNQRAINITIYDCTTDELVKVRSVYHSF